MKGKNKLSIIALLLTFFITAGMFYYQNVLLPKQEEKNKVAVLVAKRDIAEGAVFTTDNIGAIKVDKEMVLPTYVTNFEDLNGKTSSFDIFENEIVTKNRINEDGDGTKKFKLGIEAKNMPPLIQTGDYVRVYVQTASENQVLEVFEKKEVVTVNYKKSSSGQESAIVQSVDLLLSNEESVTYFDAQKTGTILLVRYNDLTEKDTYTTKKYELNSELTEQLKFEANAKPGDERKDADSKVYYIVKSGDSFESIATSFDMTKEEIKKLNPGVVTLSVGDKIIIKNG